MAGTVRCVLDGNVFNAAEVAAALGLPASISAGDLLCHAYAAWGLEALHRLRGAFAIAFWDHQRRAGLLAVDHFAVHSWYLHQSGGRVVAATDMRTLRRMLRSAARPDPEYALTWVGNAWGLPGRTFVDGVRRVEGAHSVVLEDGRASYRRWWSPRYREPLRGSRTELAGRLRACLGRAVSVRVPPDEATGVMLSGGFDSSAVTGVAATEAADPSVLRTYSAIFPRDPEIDEFARVQALMQALGLHSHLVDVHPSGLVRRALEYQRDWGVPVAGPGYMLERPLLERAARDGVRGILDGQGGDEVFGFSPLLVADRLRSLRLATAARLLTSFPDQAGRPPRRALQMLTREYALHGVLPARLERRLRLRGDPDRHRPDWIRADLAAALAAAYDPRAWKIGQGPLWWRWTAYLLTTQRDTSGQSEYIGLRGRDLGLEMRPPLFDVDLAELALRLPPELGYGGINRSLARQSVHGDLPDAVRLAQVKSNLRSYYHRALSGPDLPVIRRLVGSSGARIREYTDQEAVRRLLERPPAVGDRGWGGWAAPVWRLLTGEIALRAVEDPDSPSELLDRCDPARPLYEHMAGSTRSWT